MKRIAILATALAAAFELAAEPMERYLVATRTPSSPSRIQGLVAFEPSPLRNLRVMPHVGAYAVNLTREEAARLAMSGDVIVEPDMERSIEGMDVPGPAIGAQADAPETIPWGVTNIRAPQVWSVTKGQNVNVAVLDTGIDPEHPDLVAAYRGGFNTFEPEKLPLDGHRHGTHVAGTIAAAHDGAGLVGVAPGVNLWAVKVLHDDGRGSVEAISLGLNWVVEKKKATGEPWVVNLSVGSNNPSEVERIAVANAISEGVVIVAAAGNRAKDQLRYPGGYDNVIAVGAIDAQEKRAPFSSYGVGLGIMAPGAEVQSTMIKGIGDTADVAYATATQPADRVTGSPYGAFTGKVVLCGLGEPHEFPESVRGNIAFIRRGKLLFREKARNAKEAGAAAVILQRYKEEQVQGPSWTLYPEEPDPYWDNYPFPLTVRVDFQEGEAVLAAGLEQSTVTHRRSLYGTMSGTSMATPHVAGIVALLMSLDPDMPVAQAAYLLKATARDIYEPGWDYETSWGIADALTAAHAVAPEKFGVPPPDLRPTGRRRAVGTR
jgi:serine protease